jgi:hypothetical protein
MENKFCADGGERLILREIEAVSCFNDRVAGSRNGSLPLHQRITYSESQRAEESPCSEQKANALPSPYNYTVMQSYRRGFRPS